jgi:hypothetical protein
LPFLSADEAVASVSWNRSVSERAASLCMMRAGGPKTLLTSPSIHDFPSSVASIAPHSCSARAGSTSKAYSWEHAEVASRANRHAQNALDPHLTSVAAARTPSS